MCVCAGVARLALALRSRTSKHVLLRANVCDSARYTFFGRRSRLRTMRARRKKRGKCIMTNHSLTRSVLSLVVGWLLSSACAGGDKPSATMPPAQHHDASSSFPTTTTLDAGSSTCRLLAKMCHSRDKSSEAAHACHVLGHQAPSEEQCEAKRSECVIACGGSGEDAGGPNSGHH